MKYYVTFKQFNHDGSPGPLYDKELMDNYAILYTSDHLETASRVAEEYPILRKWKTIYTHGYSNFNINNYPKGSIGTFGKMSPEDEADEIIENIYEQRRNNREIENAGNNHG